MDLKTTRNHKSLKYTCLSIAVVFSLCLGVLSKANITSATDDGEMDTTDETAQVESIADEATTAMGATASQASTVASSSDADGISSIPTVAVIGVSTGVFFLAYFLYRHYLA